MPIKKTEVEAIARGVIEEVRFEGVPVPSRVSFAKLGKGVPAFYAFSTDELVLDERSGFWKDPETEAGRMFNAHWWSTSDPRHPIIHEIGHAAHFKTDPTLYRALEYRRWAPDEFALVVGKVSKYAETDIREFIAEVFAGIIDETEYDAAVMEIYQKFKGPSVPEPE